MKPLRFCGLTTQSRGDHIYTYGTRLAYVLADDGRVRSKKYPVIFPERHAFHTGLDDLICQMSHLAGGRACILRSQDTCAVAALRTAQRLSLNLRP